MSHSVLGEPTVLRNAILVADAVLLHATIGSALDAVWGPAPWVQVASAATAGLVGAAVLAEGADRRWTLRILWACAASLTWMAAGILGDWADSEAIFGARALPQWWYTTHEDTSGASGIAFSSGQALAGTLAGLGLALPALFNHRFTLVRRAGVVIVLMTVAALAWAGIFHGGWVACGIAIVSPGSPVEIPPPPP